MADWQGNMRIGLRYLSKYGKVLLRYLLIVLLWTIKMCAMFCSWLAPKLKWTGRWLRYALRVTARKGRVWIAEGWRGICFAARNMWRWSYVAIRKAWSWIRMASVKTAKWIAEVWSATLGWILHTKERYEEFKRTKGMKGLYNDAKNEMKEAMGKLDEDQNEMHEDSGERAEYEVIEDDEDSSPVARVGKKIDSTIQDIFGT